MKYFICFLFRADEAGDQSDSPPPIPPVRCSSVSRDRDKRFGIDVPPPPLPAKPKFDDPPGRPPPPENKTRPPSEAVSRRTPPVPPAPKRSGSDLKPAAPPLPPTHRRSKSEGRSPFGEDIPAGPGSESRLPLEKKLSDPADAEEADKGENRPLPPPRPLKHGSVRVTSSPSLVANGELAPRSAG